MKIEGHYLFHVPIRIVYEALRDEALIRQALPGRVHFVMTSPTHYEAAVDIDVPRFGGHYSGELDVLETEPPFFYRLYAHGYGMGRALQAGGIVELHEVGPGQTELHYFGETDAFDHFNRLFQMAAAPVATQLINRGLHHLEGVIHQRQATDGGRRTTDDGPQTTATTNG
jgi:carbon monoxide dehydrogenase subunit G